MSSSWHTLDAASVLSKLASALGGLAAGEAATRLATHGPNILREKNRRPPWALLLDQFRAVMVLILIAAAVLSGFLGKWNECAAILAIVLLFAFLGFFQEYRAEQAMAALKRLAVPQVRVRRDDRLKDIPATDLVPGDIVVLEAGNMVPADLRLVECVNLRIQEAALTGESEPIEKSLEPVAREDAPLGDRVNMAYMGTQVTYGRGAGVVTATGMQTELGKIADLLQSEPETATPLQRRLDAAGKRLAVVGGGVAVIVAAIDLLKGGGWADAAILAVSVAVAVVPEGLPAVVTITLALGAKRMLARRALIRKLSAVETLGSVTTICSDKTGTLTENRMTVTVLDVAGHRVDVNEEMHGRAHLALDMKAERLASSEGSLALLLIGGALCNDARLDEEAEAAPAAGKKHFHVIGDPTEAALVVAAAKYGFRKNELDERKPRIAELPFDSERKRMTTVHALNSATQTVVIDAARIRRPDARWVSFTKGSVDGLLDQSSHVWIDGAAVALDSPLRGRIEKANRSLAENGMRVLGVAFNTPASPDPAAALESGLTFIGFVGIVDPPRAEVKLAVARCRSAGIRPVMITGDHPLTALHIARELGIADAASRSLTGRDLEAMSDADLERTVEEISVFARVSPEHKLRIVQALRRRGHVAAMTGDGVNDAPALKAADIGVAMGITGTDVSKEAAKMVLQDDNFATIVAAVEEGRVIYDNIRKFVKFSLAGNLGKILVMIGGVIAGMPTPLLPLQLLWLNLLTDGLLGVGLGVEPGEKAVMNRHPVSPKAGVFSGGMTGEIARVGLVIGAISLATGIYLFHRGDGEWRSMMFTTLAFCQVWQAIAVRSGRDAVWQAGLFSNKPLLGLAVAVSLLQIAAVSVPPVKSFLGTHLLSAKEILFAALIGAGTLVYIELEKIVLRRTSARTPASWIAVP